MQEQLAPSFAQRWWVLAAVECGNFVVYMDGFIVTQALPAMAREFGVGLSTLKWVIVAFLLAVTVTLLPAGRLADIWGRKRITLVGMGVLLASAVLCAVAPNVETLIALRGVQGIGGGLVLANVMAEITAVFPKEQRRQAMAINASVLAVAQITGLVLGGLLIDQLGWRSLFFIIQAVSLLGLVLSAVILEAAPRAGGEKSLDWLGAVLSVVAVGAPFLFVERLSRNLFDPARLALLVAGAIVLTLFVVVERRAKAPLVELSLFRSRAFTCGSLSAAFYFVAAVSCYFLLPLYGQVVLRKSPTLAGVLLVPLSLALTAASLTVGRISGRLGARVLSTAGMLCVSGAVFGLSLLGTSASYFEILWPLCLLGLGGGLFQAPNNSATMNDVPAGHLSVGNGFLSTARNFGQAIGAALAAKILTDGLGAAGAGELLAAPLGVVLDARRLEAYVAAQQFAFQLAAGLGVVGAVVSMLRGTEGHVTRAANAEHA